MVYFLVVLPYNTLRKQGEVEQADDAQIVLLTEIRDLLAQTNGESSGKHGGAHDAPAEHVAAAGARTSASEAVTGALGELDLEARQLPDDLRGQRIQRRHPVAHRVAGTGEVDHQRAAGHAGQPA